MLQDDTEGSGPASWFALCELRDSNSVLLDAGSHRPTLQVRAND
jgi:hypothetical protein